MNDLKIYVGQVIVVELKDFFSFQNALAEQTPDQPLYMVDALTDFDGLGTRSYQWQSKATGNLNAWQDIDKAIYETYLPTYQETNHEACGID